MPDLVKSKAHPRHKNDFNQQLFIRLMCKKNQNQNQMSVQMATVGPHLQGVLD